MRTLTRTCLCTTALFVSHSAFAVTGAQIRLMADLMEVTQAPEEKSDAGVLRQTQSLFARHNTPLTGSVRTEWFSISGLQGAIVSDDTTFFVLFSGTNEIKDYFDNSNIWMNTEGPAHFHSGFYRKAWLGAKEFLESKFLQYDASHKKIWLSGHSYGGAMSYLTAYFIATKYATTERKAELVTFAAPAVGNGYFATSFPSHNVSAARIWRGCDLVPVGLDGEHGNPKDWNDRYQHVGRSLKIEGGAFANGEITEKPRLLSDKSVTDGDRMCALVNNWMGQHDWMAYRAFSHLLFQSDENY